MVIGSLDAVTVAVEVAVSEEEVGSEVVGEMRMY